MRNNFHHRRISTSGFTLVELSIVLVIIGLLVGSVTVGGSMMNGAKIRNITTRVHEYTSSITDFRQKYNAYPGDMANAIDMWGVSTTDGNGDGMIGRVVAQNGEIFRAWQHLKEAGFIAGDFTGMAGSAGSSQALVGVNVPKGEIGQSGYDVVYIEDSAIPAAYFAGLSYRHVIHYGTQVAGNNFARGAALSAADAFGVDQKIDDGLPATGALVTYTNTAQPTCASTDVATTAIYQVANSTDNNCTLVFLTGF